MEKEESTMRNRYRTSSINDENRKRIPTGVPFDICEHCGLDKTNCKEEDTWKNVRFFEKYNQVLCDECVDRKDGTWNMRVYEENGELKAHYPMTGKTVTLSK